MKIDLRNKFNPKLFDFFRSKNRIQILYGSRLSGKSYGAAQKVILMCLRNKDLRAMCVRKTYPALKDTSLDLILTILEDWHIRYRRKRIPGGDIIYFENDSSIRFRSIDTAQKLRSSFLNLVWIEEANELNEEDFDELLLTLRRKGPKMIIMTFNPTSKLHWLYKRFFLQKNDDIFIKKFNYTDNIFLSPEEKAVLQSYTRINPELAKSWVFGNFMDRGNLIYTNWQIINNLPDINSLDEIILGIDFGFVNPFAAVLIGIKENKLYILDEIKKTNELLKNLIPEIKNMIMNFGYDYRNVPVYPDPARPDHIEELMEAGFSVMTTDNSVLPGISFIQNYKILVYKKCQKFIDEISAYSWKKDRNGQIVEIPDKTNDHLMDAFRYAVYTHLKHNTFFNVSIKF